MMNEPGWHAWGMGWGWILGFLLLVVIIWIVVRITSRNRSVKSPESKSALDILKDRYARGEIDKSEFDKRKGDLQ